MKWYTASSPCSLLPALLKAIVFKYSPDLIFNTTHHGAETIPVYRLLTSFSQHRLSTARQIGPRDWQLHQPTEEDPQFLTNRSRHSPWFTIDLIAHASLSKLREASQYHSQHLDFMPATVFDLFPRFRIISVQYRNATSWKNMTCHYDESLFDSGNIIALGTRWMLDINWCHSIPSEKIPNTLRTTTSRWLLRIDNYQIARHTPQAYHPWFSNSFSF